MNSNYLISPLMLIVNTLFDLYILLVLLRFMLQALRADFYNPVSQFIVKLTALPLKALRRVVPSIAGQDSASVLLCLLLIYAKFMLLRLLDIPAVQIASSIAPIGSASYLGLVVFAIADLIALVFSVFLIAIVVQVIISWVNPGQYNPVIGLVNTLTAPVLRPVQKLLPTIGGLDLSPMLAVLLLLVGKMVVIPPLVYLAQF